MQNKRNFDWDDFDSGLPGKKHRVDPDAESKEPERRDAPIYHIRPVPGDNFKIMLFKPKVPYEFFETRQIQPHITLIRLTNKPIVDKPPMGILFIDIDETLVKFEESAYADQLIFINLQKHRDKFKALLKEGYKLIPCTARDYKDELNDHYLSVLNILNEVMQGAFEEMVFTGGGHKHHSILYFGLKYNLPMHKLCLMDDNDKYLYPCKVRGITTIKVKPDSDDYLDELDALSSDV